MECQQTGSFWNQSSWWGEKIIARGDENWPVVLTNFEFGPKKGCTNNIVELFDLPDTSINWDYFYNMPAKMVISPQGNEVLVKLSLENLKNKNIQEDKALKILKEWQKQKSEITVRVIYKDILGNIQPEMSFRLK